MNPSRRRFLGTSAVGVLGAGLAGCDSIGDLLVPSVVRPIRSDAIAEVPATPQMDLLTHVLNRLSFGPAPGDYDRLKGLGKEPQECVDRYIEEQLHPETIDDSECEYAVRRLETLALPTSEMFEYQQDLLLRELTTATTLRAVFSRRQLQEVMVGFWSDHFNIDSSKGDCRWLKTADDREVIRKHALGNFPDLLRASASSPAMLWYLDGRVNSKRSEDEKPNENYARELMELHTLGVDGGYTQSDVMEVARCLTGWTVRSDQWLKKGAVEFHPERHDNGEKRILARTVPAGGGEKDLDRVLDILQSHPSTARYVCGKLCRKFVSDSPSEATVGRVAESFLATGGDIRSCLATLFSTPEFLESKGVKFKRPFRFIVSAVRALGAESDGAEGIYDYLLRMGHAPYQYPTPDGYPEQPGPWMGTLLWRWKFAENVSRNRIAGTRVDLRSLAEQAGGEDSLAAHFLGRIASPAETPPDLSLESRVALWIASPDFQRC